VRPGKFITFEGIEGTGKTTQIERLAARLRQAAVDVVVTREPGGTELGRELRQLLLRTERGPISPLCELLLYAADRCQHLEEVIEPALQLGSFVLCDRYRDATLAYQGYGRRLGVDAVLALHRQAPLDRLPDRTVLLDLPPERALRRARRRNEENETVASEGRFERERLAFHRRVRGGYLELASREPGRIRLVDATGSRDQVELRVLAALQGLLPELEAPTC
jgi:dTMP kinase